MASRQSPLDDAHERPSRAAKSQAMESAVWRGAARQGPRKRTRSTSPACDPQSMKRAKSHLAGPGHRGTTMAKGIQRQKVSRKPPVAIISDEGEDNQASPIRPSKNGRKPPCLAESAPRPHHKHCDQEDDEDSESGSGYTHLVPDIPSDGVDDADGDDDLRGLGNEELASVLASERVRWSSKSNKDNRALGVRDVELSTASELDGRSFGDQDQEDVEHQPTSSNDEDPLLPPQRKYKVSKRESARRAEVPRFTRDVATASQPRKSVQPSALKPEASSDDETVDAHQANKGWRADAHYIPPQSGARIISIKVQPPSLQAVLKASIREVTGDALFVTAYPSALTITDYYCDILKRSAENLRLEMLHDRFKRDPKFSEVISRVLAVRLSHLRCILKRTAAFEVKGFYNLIPGDACKDRVRKLITTTEYIYRRAEGGPLLRTKPFLHPCIISTLKEWAFTSTRGVSLAEKHARRFRSSIEHGPQADEKEMPIAMVCLAATAVHAALDDWADGYPKKTEFNADLYEEVYKGHTRILTAIKEQKPAGFHRLMSDIYMSISSKHAQQATSVANTAMAVLDLDGMDE